MDIKITFAGDLICFLPQLQASHRKDGYDFSAVFNKVSSLFQHSNYVVGSLETPIAGQELGFTSAPTNFNSPIEFAQAAKDAGFSFFSIANNHCLDRGLEGLFNTIDNLKKLEVDFSGGYKTSAESQVPFIKSINGLRVAVLAFTYGTNSEWLNNGLDEEHKNCVDLFRKQDDFHAPAKGHFKSILNPIKNLAKNLPQSIREKIKPFVIEDCVKTAQVLPCDEYYDEKLRDKISHAKENSDIVIIYMHSGGQFNSHVGAYTKALARRLIDYGCDYVIGSHPHCVLNYEIYKGKFIAYSLGNFCYTPNYGYHYDGVYSDYSIVLNFYLDTEEKKLTKKTASVTKTVLEPNGNSVVWPVSLLVKEVSEKQKQQLKKDVEKVLCRFLGKETAIDIEKAEIDID